MTTTQDLIAQLRALGIPDWAMARVLMTQAADTLEAAQAEHTDEVMRGLMLEKAHAMGLAERDAALARLAELEKQEPAYLLTPDGKCYAYGSAQPLSAGHADATLLKLYTAAGASPVEPSQARVVEPFEVDWPEYHQQAMGCGHEDHGIRDRYEAMQYGWDQAIERVAERLPETLYATPQAAAQPPAPSDTTITYMTGYSDGREWAGATNQAQPSQAVELDYEKKLDIVSNWFSDEGMQSRAMQMLGDIEQAIAAAPQPKEPK